MGNTNLKASDLDPDNFQGKSAAVSSTCRLLAWAQGILGRLGWVAGLIDRQIPFKLEVQRGHSSENHCIF